MAIQSIPCDEQETVIRYGRNDKWASVWTSDSTTMTRLDKFANDPENDNYNVEEEGTIDGKTVTKTYTVKKRLISFRSANIVRNLTDEQKAEQAERIKTMWEKRRAERESS